MKNNAVYDVVKQYADEIGLGNLSPHDLRRTYISLLIDKGVDLVTVSKMAGHRHIGQTAEYDRRGDSAKQRAAKMFDDIWD